MVAACAAVTVSLLLGWGGAAAWGASGSPAVEPALAAVLDFKPRVRVVVRDDGGRLSAALESTDPKAKVPVAPPGSVQIRFLQPSTDTPVAAGSVWLAVGFRGDRPIRSVHLYWAPWGQPATEVRVEVAGPTEQEGTAWAQVQGVQAGRWVAAAVVETVDGRLAAAAADFRVVGDASLQPRLDGLAQGLDRRDRATQVAVDEMARTGELWKLLARRFGAPSQGDGGGLGQHVGPPFAVGGLGLDAVGGALVLTGPVFLHALVEDVPEGYLAAGVRAYEAVREAPYWVNSWERPEDSGARTWDAPGSGQYRPDAEIPGWEHFLEEYASHPAADDAAYRLGRSFEVRAMGRDAADASGRARDIRQAALAYLVAAALPDGDMRRDALGRLVFLLDAVASEDELGALASLAGSDEPETGPKSSAIERLAGPRAGAYLACAARYALAVRLLRGGEYDEAAGQLAAVTRVVGEVPLPWDGWDPLGFRRSDTEDALSRQSVAARLLAEGQAEGQADPGRMAQRRYEEAAAIYREPLLFYLPLWHGERAAYLAFGHVFDAADAGLWDASALRRYVQAHNTYVRALELFERLLGSDPPEPWKEKAFFSRAMTLRHLVEYGFEVRYWRDPSALKAEAVRSFEAFAREYPDSPLADDALLMVGVYGEDGGALEELLRRYPDGDMRPLAERLLGARSERAGEPEGGARTGAGPSSGNGA